MDSTPAVVKVAPTDQGCCVRLEGRGTMQQSPAAREMALGTLGASPESVVVFDLTDCTYLDSTFQGCLLELYRSFDRGASSPRFLVAAPAERRKALLGQSHIDRLLPSLDAAPTARGEWVTVPIGDLDAKARARHVLACHRALAEIDSPMRGAFARIADQLERELASAPADPA